MVLFRIVFFMAVFMVLSAGSASAQTPSSSWFNGGHPSVNSISENLPDGLVPPYSDRECLPETKFITVPRNIFKPQVEVSQTACAFQSGLGLQNPYSADIKLNDSELAGPTRTFEGGQRLVETIPGSRDVVYRGSALYGSPIYILRDFPANSEVQVNPNGSIFHRLKNGVSGQLITEPNGEQVNFKEIRFSSNGKWMVGEVPFKGMTRVNMETGQTLRFGPPYSHSNGSPPHFVSAISNDGRYVVATDIRDYETFSLYDLANCQPSCRSVDLLPVVKSKVPDIQGVLHVSFSTDHTLRFYFYRNNGVKSYYAVTAPGETESLLSYLAVGDSFASGEGAYNYKPGTDVRHPSNKCHLSTVSYPYLLNPAAQSVACSGAKMKDIFFSSPEADYSYDQRQSEGKHDPSHDQAIYSSFLPGYRTQLSFVEKYKPAAVTVSISGNDIGFGKVLLACVMPGDCYDSPQEKLDIFYTINTKFDQLVSTYTQAKEKSAIGAKVYALGYPSLAIEGNCALNVHLSKQEIVFSNQIISYLNSVIKRAADKSGVAYVDLENSLAGARLCETVSPNTAVHGLTAGDDKTLSIPLKFTSQDIDLYLSARESYHPNQLGHRMLAQAISKATNNLSAPGLPPANVPPPNLQEAATSAGSQNLSPRKIIYPEKLAESLIYRGKQAAISQNGLMPGADAKVLYKQGPFIGNFRASASGSLSISSSIPADTMPSFYMLEVQTKNTSGEDISLQQLVYVASSETDIDGDGTPNDREACLLVHASGVDADKDSVDDACDSQITDPPAFIPVSLSKTVQLNTASSSTGSYNGELKVSQVITHAVLASSSPAAIRNLPAPVIKTQGSLSLKPLLLPILLTLVALILCLKWRKRP